MFEIFGKLGNSRELENPYRDNRFYQDKDFRQMEIDCGELHLYALNHEADDSYFEDDSHVVLILGKVWLKQSFCDTPRSSRLSAKEIHRKLQAETNFYDSIKGEFTIVVYSKAKKKLRLINDQFGLRPFYYGWWGDAFYFGNNLNHFRALGIPLDESIVLEKLLFTYPIFDRSYLAGISVLGGGVELIADDTTCHKKERFHLDEFVFNGNGKKFEAEEFVDIFNHSVLQRLPEHAPVVASLTGGFDGRAVVSALLAHGEKFTTYSFGRKGGENTEIPEQLSQRLGFNYAPIYLEEEYEEKFRHFAAEALYFSDGMSFISRANYPFAFEKLSEKAHTVLTGLIAGEVLRPIHLRTDYMNRYYYDVVYERASFDPASYLSESGKMKFIDDAFVARNCDAIAQRIEQKREEIQRNRMREDGFLFYLCDLIRLGFRRYYGTEMHLERPYAHNTAPFFDYDLLAYLLKTDYREIFRNAFKSHPIHRWRGQEIYAKIYQHNCPELGRYPVDRGYPPEFLLNPLKRLAVPYLYYKRKNRLDRSPPEFSEERWSAMFYRDFIGKRLPQSDMFDVEGFHRVFRDNDISVYRESFNRLFSIYAWLHFDDIFEMETVRV